MIKRIWHYAALIFAIAVLLLGLILFLLPIPLGFFVLVVGIALLLTVSVTARLWFHRLRRRYPMLDTHLARVEPHLPESLRKVLQADNIS